MQDVNTKKGPEEAQSVSDGQRPARYAGNNHF